MTREKAREKQKGSHYAWNEGESYIEAGSELATRREFLVKYHVSLGISYFLYYSIARIK